MKGQKWTTIATPSSNPEFITYSNYFQTLADYLSSQNDKDLKRFLSDVAKSQTFKKISGGKCFDEAKLNKLMRNAWTTELLMSVSVNDADFVPHANLWLPVQLYYSTYSMIRAYFIASGQRVESNHSKSLSSIGSELKDRNQLFPTLFSVVCTVSIGKGNRQYINLPKGIQIDESINPLSKSDFWNSYGMLLRTTRDRELEKHFSEWKRKHHKKRISAKTKQEIANKLRPTHFFDFLYRLRLRSNYADADAFIENINEESAKEYAQATKTICWFTLFSLELLIAKYLGKRKYVTVVEKFDQSRRSNIGEDLVGRRCKLLQELL